jgi:hypothetical protein
MEKAHEQSTLVVGKYYLVAHVTAFCKNTGKKLYDEPIFPIYHSDPQFAKAADILHYHKDGRFRKGIHFSNSIVSNADVDLSEVFYIRKKCVSAVCGLYMPQEQKSWLVWQKSMVGKSCKGKKCPHRGAMMIEVDGHLFCPMHNLVGCAKTEKIVDKFLGNAMNALTLPNYRIIDAPKEAETFDGFLKQK